ncbi:unnamed protein product [Sphagnum jensenii]|uniref:RING-type E3 ubiquitin transferase n=1 Tax=Sphagnum jensenii TaxID=128206 RepID=A0ABP0WDU8_9BRYO
MVRLTRYAAVSAVGATAIVYHAFKSREQFYPAMVYLSTSKISLVLLLNMALVILCLIWQLIKGIFLGSLREAEVERLNEQSWREVMEILFAMTIFRQEFNVMFVVMITVLLFIKALHWLAQKRVEYIETTPSVSRLSHFRIITFMVFLLGLDIIFLRFSVVHLLKTRTASVSLFFAFEYVILATSTVATFLKYLLYIGDMVMEGQWENKAVYIFYLELVRDLLHLSLYLFFFLVIFINYGLPLHLVRELYETFRNFKARVADFIRYRKITSNMNDRFPDATTEDLGLGDATCIICREEMSSAKKLPCGHFFHVHCLRSWLERQQTCPTCRAPVLSPDNVPAANGTDPAAHHMHPPHQDQPAAEVGRPTTSSTSSSSSEHGQSTSAAEMAEQHGQLHAQATATLAHALEARLSAQSPVYGFVPVAAFGPTQPSQDTQNRGQSSQAGGNSEAIPGARVYPSLLDLQQAHLGQYIEGLQRQLQSALQLQRQLSSIPQEIDPSAVGHQDPPQPQAHTEQQSSVSDPDNLNAKGKSPISFEDDRPSSSGDGGLAQLLGSKVPPGGLGSSPVTVDSLMSHMNNQADENPDEVTEEEVQRQGEPQ